MPEPVAPGSIALAKAKAWSGGQASAIALMILTESVCQQRVVAAQAYYDLNTTVFTMSKSGPVSKGANIVIAPTTADTVVNERPSSSIFAV